MSLSALTEVWLPVDSISQIRIQCTKSNCGGYLYLKASWKGPFTHCPLCGSQFSEDAVQAIEGMIAATRTIRHDVVDGKQVTQSAGIRIWAEVSSLLRA